MAIWERKDTKEIRYAPAAPSRNWHQITTGRVKELEAREAIQKAKAQYAPGGAFGTGVEAAITRGRTKAVSAGAQELVGAGLAGTTMVGGLGTRYEEEVGMPARLSIEERRAQALSGIEMAQAGMAQQTGLAATQMQFQAGQAGQQRELQRYIAELQAKLQREQMAFRQPTMAAPTGGGYARQFPSIYGEAGQPVPDILAGGGLSPVAAAGMVTADKMTSFAEPPTGSVPMGRRYGPTIEEPLPSYLDQHQPIRATDVLSQWGY